MTFALSSLYCAMPWTWTSLLEITLAVFLSDKFYSSTQTMLLFCLKLTHSSHLNHLMVFRKPDATPFTSPPIAFLTSDPSTLAHTFLLHWVRAILAFLLFFQHSRETPISRPLHCLFFLPEALFSQIFAWLTPSHLSVLAQMSFSQLSHRDHLI